MMTSLTVQARTVRNNTTTHKMEYFLQFQDILNPDKYKSLFQTFVSLGYEPGALINWHFIVKATYCFSFYFLYIFSESALLAKVVLKI